MLRTLSYLNLIGAVCYFLVYLQNAAPVVILGLLATVVYQWLILLKLERGLGSKSVPDVVFAIFTLAFALYLAYSAIFLLLDMVEYQYYIRSTLFLIGSGIMLMLGLLFHLFLSWREKLVKKDD